MSRTDAAGTLSIGLAVSEDVDRIGVMIAAAYGIYVRRLGRLPAPMTADIPALVRDGQVHVLRLGGSVVGTVSLSTDGDALAVNELAVDPSLQGNGYGRMLMRHAEAVARTLNLRTVTLYTNERMHENIAFYRGLGFTETTRRSAHGFDRVFFCKELGAEASPPMSIRHYPAFP